MRVVDDEFWLYEADPEIDICDTSVSVEACLGIITDEIDAHVPIDDARIVEIGCGIGRLANPLQNIYPNSLVYGIDITPRFLAAAFAAGMEMEHHPLYILAGSLAAVPAVRGSDAIYSMCVFQHIDNDRKREYIIQAGHVLKPGGVFVVQFVEGVHSSRCMYDALTSDMVGWFESAGFDIRRVQHDLIMPKWTWITATRNKT